MARVSNSSRKESPRASSSPQDSQSPSPQGPIPHASPGRPLPEHRKREWGGKGCGSSEGSSSEGGGGQGSRSFCEDNSLRIVFANFERILHLQHLRARKPFRGITREIRSSFGKCLFRNHFLEVRRPPEYSSNLAGP